MQKIFLKQGLFSNRPSKDSNSLDLTQEIARFLTTVGLYNNYDCCKGVSPVNGSSLIWDGTLGKYVSGSGGGGALTNLGYIDSPLNGVITNSNGAGFTIPLVNATNAGLATPAMFSASTSLASASSTTQIPFGVGSNGYNSSPNFTWNNTTNELTVNGKLNVSGGIDPIYLQFVESTTTLTPTGTTKGAIYVSNGTDGQTKNHLIYKSDIGVLTDLLLGGSVDSVFGRTGVVTAVSGDYTATQITNVPTGNISSVTVQAAITELDTNKAPKVVGTLTLTNTDVVATDTVSEAIGKLQAQLDNSVSVTVENNVTSTSTVNALSANQGKLLNDADIVSGAIVGTNLVLTLKGGATVTIDATTLLADVKLTSGVYNTTTKALDLTLSDTTLVSIPVSSLLPVTTNATLTGDGATTPLGISLSTDVGQAITLGTDGKILYVPQVIADASETVKGIVELATQVELELGTSTTLVPTVKGVSDTFIAKSVGDNSGDLITFSADNVPAILALGSDGYILTADYSNIPTRLSWKKAVPSRFILDFTVSTWVVGSTESTITIPFATHVITNPTVTVRELTGVLFRDVGVVVEVHSTTNDIVMYVTNGNTFAGRVIVL